MAGYEPDSRHTISMMIAALLGVLVWTVLGYGEYVFPSVPGMGAAFAVHLHTVGKEKIQFKPIRPL